MTTARKPITADELLAMQVRKAYGMPAGTTATRLSSAETLATC